TTARDLAIAVGSDVLKRPFITVGFTAWMCMLPLAITSTAGMIRRLGGGPWPAPPPLTFAAAAVGGMPYLWLGQTHRRRPEMYAVIVAGLLACRVWRWARPASAPQVRRVAA